MTNLITRKSALIFKAANLIVGAVIGFALKLFLQSSLSVLIAIIALVAVAILVILVTGEEITSEARTIAKDVANNHKRQQDDINALSTSLTDSMADLTSRFGLRVDRLLTSEVNGFSSIDEDKSARMILSAKKELYILDLISEDGCWPDDAMNQEILGEAFRGMISLTENSPSLTYKRIVQLANTDSGLHNAGNPTFLGHCRDILSSRRKTEERTVLKMAPRRFPFKFVLIDNECLILQLQEYNGQRLQLWGELRITDPGRNLISVFRKIWDSIDNDAIPVRAEHLPPASNVADESAAGVA